jgi:hypothetical protein
MARFRKGVRFPTTDDGEDLATTGTTSATTRLRDFSWGAPRNDFT